MTVKSFGWHFVRLEEHPISCVSHCFWPATIRSFGNCLYDSALLLGSDALANA